MSHISEKADWEEGIYELRSSDPVLGGSEGISNRQAAQLANRTRWLKQSFDRHSTAPDPHPQYREVSEAVREELDTLGSSMNGELDDIRGNLSSLNGNVSHLLDLAESMQHSQQLMWGALGTPPGTRSLFVQSTAPTGWTKLLEHHDKALRVVSGEATAGGTQAFSMAFASRAISGTSSATTLSEAQMPGHSHKDGVAESNNDNSYRFGYSSESSSANVGIRTGVGGELWYYKRYVHPYTNTTGSSAAHSHGLSITPLDLRVQYVDVIIASKDYYEPA